MVVTIVTTTTVVLSLVKKQTKMTARSVEPEYSEQKTLTQKEEEEGTKESESEKVPGKPIGNPLVSKITNNSVILSWGEPESNSELVDGYTIFYCVASESSRSTNTQWSQYSIVGKFCTAEVKGLKSKIMYIFKVRPESKAGSGPESDLSNAVETRQSLANFVRCQSQTIEKKCPEILKPPMEHKKGKRKRLSWYHIIGKSNLKSVNTPNEKVLLLIGATGAGKSTLINGFLNYVMGVCWDDDFRFKIIVDEGGKSQAHSQTSKITAYSIHGSCLPYTLTVIDTPGIGDTRGMERDKAIVNQIKELFSTGGPDSVDQINGVGFVTQASTPRLTPTMKYIFDSVLSIFGKDISSNIFLLMTFADGQEPPVLSAIEEAAIPYHSGFQFNNSALYANQAGNVFDEMFWKLGMDNFQHFITEFEKAEAHSLQLTRETLKERQQLEAVVEGLKMQIKVGLTKIDTLRQEQRILRKREAEILQNEHFTYELTITKQRQVDLPGVVFVTNCLQCNFTCHYPCPIPKDSEKYQCKAMGDGGPDGAHCTVCPGNCHWSQHVNAPYRFELYYEVETHTSDDLKKNLSEAIEGKNQIKARIANIEKELDKLQEAIVGKVRGAKRSLERLQEIALKPNPLSEIEYIDLLIKAEKSEKSPGYTERIKGFEIIKDIVKQHDQVGGGKEMDSTWWRNAMTSKK